MKKAASKKPYSKPTATKLTQAQAKKLLMDRTGCSDEEATELLKSLMAEDEKPSTKQTKELEEELAALSTEQFEALQTAAYVNMSQDEVKLYDKRAVRISELCGLLGKAAASGGKGLLESNTAESYASARTIEA